MIAEIRRFTVSANSLQTYLSVNFSSVYDFFTSSTHQSLSSQREEIRSYIGLNLHTILELNPANKTNVGFISLLLDVCERLAIINHFATLYQYLKHSNCEIGCRLEAAASYLIGVNQIEDYIGRYDQIYGKLQEAYEDEEDNSERVLVTMANYYALVVLNFGSFQIDGVQRLRRCILESQADSDISFLSDPVMREILTIPLEPCEAAYNQIQAVLDQAFLQDHAIDTLADDEFDQQERALREEYIETGTTYCERLDLVDASFDSIRRLSVESFRAVGSDELFYSLMRGVKILTDENELFAYMNSLAPMHFRKLMAAFRRLPDDLFPQRVTIVDWGCGQAIGTMTYLEYLKSLELDLDVVQSVVLIEPSEIALKRAALHVRKYLPETDVHTINRTFDNLTLVELPVDYGTKVHIFSNVLDMETFSLQNIITLVRDGFNGQNYFVCVSPYISDIRNSRLEAFYQRVSSGRNFNLIQSLQEKDWGGISRSVRLFQVDL